MKERETLICCFTYLSIHWLILVCALTRDCAHSLGTEGRRSNQLSHLARGDQCALFPGGEEWFYTAEKKQYVNI